MRPEKVIRLATSVLATLVVTACAPRQPNETVGDWLYRQTPQGHAEELARQQQAQAQRRQALWQAQEAEEAQAERQKAEQEAAAEAKRQQRLDELASAAARRQKEAAQKEAAKERAAENARLVAVHRQEAQDKRDGFVRREISDILLDYKSMPDGTRVVVTGLHYSIGDVEALSADPYGTEFVYLDTEGLSRSARKAILNCHRIAPFCRATVWAHTGCSVTSFGQPVDHPCLVVDGLRGGTYDYPSPGGVLR